MTERGLFKWDDERKCLVKVDKAPRIQTHAVHCDEMPPMQSMVDGSLWTSKAAYRAHLRRHGKIEVGNETGFQYRPDPRDEEREEEQIRETCAQAYYDLRDGNAELDELDRERCKAIDRNNERYVHDRRPRDRYGNLLDPDDD